LAGGFSLAGGVVDEVCDASGAGSSANLGFFGLEAAKSAGSVKASSWCSMDGAGLFLEGLDWRSSWLGNDEALLSPRARRGAVGVDDSGLMLEGLETSIGSAEAKEDEEVMCDMAYC
jgi:hypothetical protein